MHNSAIEVILEEIARINNAREELTDEIRELNEKEFLLDSILEKLGAPKSNEEVIQVIQSKPTSPYPNEGVQVGMKPSEALMAFIATNPGCTRKEIMSACESWCCNTKSKNPKNLISSTLGSAGFRKRITKKGAKFYVK